MIQDQVITIIAKGLVTAAEVAGPVVLTVLVVGLLISIIQSATQIQEQTLSFVPKLGAAAIVLVITGSWSLRVLTAFTRELFNMIPQMLNT